MVASWVWFYCAEKDYLQDVLFAVIGSIIFKVEVITLGQSVSVQNPIPTDGDSIYVKDIDFDGVLDLWIPAPEKKGYKFYSFNPSLDNFEMNFLSKLYDLKIDTEKQRATGYTYDYEFYGGAPDSKTEYVLQGKNLPVVKKQIIPLNWQFKKFIFQNFEANDTLFN